MKRSVLLTIDDDAIANLIVTFAGPAVDQRAVWRGDVEQLGGMIVPVPPGDQLTRALDRAAVALEDSIRAYKTLARQQEPGSESMQVYQDQIEADRFAFFHLRAALGLDEESDDEE